MSGMEILGRDVNIIPIASGEPFKMRGASTAMIVVTGATAVITMQQQTGFGGSPSAFYCIKNVYWSTATNGTAAWNKLTYNLAVAPYLTGGASSAPGALSTYTHGTTTGLTTATCSVFHVFTSELSDPTNYVVATATGSGLCAVVLGDLVSERAPANLEILAS
jgi:hypothetical protein